MKNKTTVIILSILLFLAVGTIVWQNLPQKNMPSVENNEEVGASEIDDMSGVTEERVEDLPEAATYPDLLIGEWQSVEDPQSVISFYRNGEMNDVYAGGAVNESGSYQLFDSANALPTEVLESLPDIEGVSTYLRQSFGAEDYYYAVLELNDTSLVLSYLSRGNTLEYRRIDG